MKNNTKLTLTSLKKEMELLRKNSYQQPPLTSTPNTSKLLSLFSFTAILAYANKIPVLSKVIKLLGIWYGKTTWWGILVKLRKLFVVINAVIGVYTTISIVGFSPDNLIGGFMALGTTYFEMISYALRKLFSWFVHFLDDYVVPKPPIEPSGDYKVWKWGEGSYDNRPVNPNPITKENIERYPAPSYENYDYPRYDYTRPNRSNWTYYDIAWYGGVALSIAAVIGLIYIISNGTLADYISPFNSSATPPGSPPHGSTGATPTGSVGGDIPDIQINDERTPSIFSFIGTKLQSAVGYLNPLSYYTPENIRNSEFTSFMERQNNSVTADYRFYPFTEINPFMSWFEKLNLSIYGESSAARELRENLIRAALQEYENIRVRPEGMFRDTPIPSSPIGNSSPIGAGIGLGQSMPSIDPSRLFEPDAHFNYVDETIRSIPPTPTIPPTNLPTDVPFQPDVDAWTKNEE